MAENHTLEKLKIYILSRELSKIAWEIYENLDWQTKKIMGDQFIESTDSVGANIAEGYGRFHYLDRIKFFYNSRGSLLESHHWLELLKDRNKVINKGLFEKYIENYSELCPKLNAFINSVYNTQKESTSHKNK